MSGAQEGDAITKRIADLRALVRGTAKTLTANSQIVKDSPDPLGRQRDWIGKVIIAVFAGALVFGFAAQIREGFLVPSGAGWKDVAAQSTDLIRSAVLPIVTLVLWAGQPIPTHKWPASGTCPPRQVASRSDNPSKTCAEFAGGYRSEIMISHVNAPA